MVSKYCKLRLGKSCFILSYSPSSIMAWEMKINIYDEQHGQLLLFHFRFECLIQNFWQEFRPFAIKISLEKNFIFLSKV